MILYLFYQLVLTTILPVIFGKRGIKVKSLYVAAPNLTAKSCRLEFETRGPGIKSCACSYS